MSICLQSYDLLSFINKLGFWGYFIIFFVALIVLVIHIVLLVFLFRRLAEISSQTKETRDECKKMNTTLTSINNTLKQFYDVNKNGKEDK